MQLKVDERERDTREAYLYVNIPIGNQTEKLQQKDLFGTNK